MMTGARKWVRVTPCENIPLREGRAVRFDNREIAIFNLGDRFLAIDNRCPHKGGPLSEGIVSDTTVVCPLHAWKIDLETGSVANLASPVPCLDTYRTRVEDGILLLELPLAPSAKHQSFPSCLEHDKPLRWVAPKPLARIVLLAVAVCTLAGFPSFARQQLGSANKPRPSGELNAGAGYSFGSGDSNPTDNTHGAFFQILPTPRPYVGYGFSVTTYYAHAWGKSVIASIYPTGTTAQFGYVETTFRF